MSGRDVDSFTVKARTGSDKPRQKTDGDYLSCPLPEEILDYGFEPGEKVYVSLGSDVVDGEEIYFIRVSYEEIGRHRLNIRTREDLYPSDFIRIPIEYTFHREEQSFHGLEKGDEMVVELDSSSDEFRVYTSEDFRYRLEQLSEQGVLPLVRSPDGAPIDFDNGLDVIVDSEE